MKKMTFTLTFLIAMSANIAAAVAGLVTLKPSIAVQNEQITFGDVFEGAEEKADYVIAPAPAPGKKVVFKASSLAYVARKHGLDWRPSRAISRIVVKRAGVRIPQQRILEEIRFALEDELQTGQFELSLSTQHPNIQVSTDEEQSISVASLSYSKRGNNFVAVLIAPATGPNARQYKLTGRIHRQLEIPVANRLIQPGEKITEQDLEFVLVRASKVARNTLTDPMDIVGKSPRRTLRPGHQLSVNNLGDPVTVAKGKLVTVIFKSKGIRLAVTGRALEPGAEGDIIRVENIASRKTIQAQIINAEEVHIISAGQRLANLN
ncbi:flagellar basal body P-ring formation chaperone FlgA [Sneathiella sp.]|jgi:flagella basal body P-ring formation protein FlgA|uniref:flagellar basal body P-ring formation chaperone FlgA n=1 Tax=Sneathiella sp. TaxID=1964365 RepID=UPI0039E45BA9